MPDWDSVAATEVACDSIVFTTDVCGAEGSAEAGRRRSAPDPQTGKICKSSTAPQVNTKTAFILDLIRARNQTPLTIPSREHPDQLARSLDDLSRQRGEPLVVLMHGPPTVRALAKGYRLAPQERLRSPRR